MTWILGLSILVLMCSSVLLLSAVRDRHACLLVGVNGPVLMLVADTAHRAMIKIMASCIVIVLTLYRTSPWDPTRDGITLVLLCGLLLLTVQNRSEEHTSELQSP